MGVKEGGGHLLEGDVFSGTYSNIKPHPHKALSTKPSTVLEGMELAVLELLHWLMV